MPYSRDIRILQSLGRAAKRSIRMSNLYVNLLKAHSSSYKHVIEVSFWADSEGKGISRTGRTADTQPVS